MPRRPALGKQSEARQAPSLARAGAAGPSPDGVPVPGCAAREGARPDHRASRGCRPSRNIAEKTGLAEAAGGPDAGDRATFHRRRRQLALHRSRARYRRARQRLAASVRLPARPTDRRALGLPAAGINDRHDMRGSMIRFAAPLLLAAGLSTAASAQAGPAVRGPSLLMHGNYCGPGNNAPLPPIDALDAACARHDACTPDGDALPTRGCNLRLQREAELIARDPRQPDDLRAMAGLVAVGAGILPSEPGLASAPAVVPPGARGGLHHGVALRQPTAAPEEAEVGLDAE